MKREPLDLSCTNYQIDGNKIRLFWHDEQHGLYLLEEILGVQFRQEQVWEDHDWRTTGFIVTVDFKASPSYRIFFPRGATYEENARRCFAELMEMM